ncbi:MAG TPA: glycosyltransferase [Candidatus Acidoferrales bacterium]|nr:glycosyltransferase [Candidatus Acidoferrales bacterium]
MTKVSVIIVSYNVREFLENLLASLRHSLVGLDSEIIVVDNSSDDDTVEFVKRDFPEAKIIENRTNVGFGKANNQGAKIAKGEYLLIINPDAVVQEDTVKEMIDFMAAHPEAGAASCKVLNADGTLQKSCRRGFPTPWVAFTRISGLSILFPRTKTFGKYNLTYLDPEKVHEVDAIGGSFMFIPRRVFLEVGGFDEAYFMYGEDIDLCYKIKQAGYKVYYTPQTTAIHFKGESTRRSSINQTYEFYRAMNVFVEKRYGTGTLLSRLLNGAIIINRQTRTFMNFVVKISPMLADFCTGVVAVFVGEFFKAHRIFEIPGYGRPFVYFGPAVAFILFGAGFGIYGENKFSVRLSFLSTLLTFLLFSSLTYFFKEFAFSRLIVLVACFIMAVIIPGWRLLYQLKTSVGPKRHPVFGRRTLVVGTDERAVELIRKIRAKISMGYEIVGIVSELPLLETRILGIRIVGALSELPQIIWERKIDEVIFASGKISYSQMLQTISNVNKSGVSLKLVPDTIDVIVGKTYVDGLADVPLLDIDYNINRTRNKVLKRVFDVLFAVAGMILLCPVALVKRSNSIRRVFEKLPGVIKGELSVVGCSEYYPQGNEKIFGKVGITGVVQLNRGQFLSDEEVEKLYVYYAKNQSFWLDLEIIAKSFLQMFR